MENKFRWSVLSLIGIGLMSLSSIACGDDGAEAKTQAPPRRYQMYLDLSASIAEKQRAHWEQIIRKILDDVKPGDAVVIYGIHDQTLAAAPLVEDEVPAIAGEAVLVRVMKANQALKKVRESALAAVTQALTTGRRSSSTDVLSVIDRYRPDPAGRQTMIVLFSDMLHSLPELNLERTRLVPERLPGLIVSIAKQHRWHNRTLAGSTVHCILNSVDSGEPQPLNDRRVLRLFYESLFQALGARLLTFDTTFSTFGGQQ